MKIVIACFSPWNLSYWGNTFSLTHTLKGSLFTYNKEMKKQYFSSFKANQRTIWACAIEKMVFTKEVLSVLTSWNRLVCVKWYIDWRYTYQSRKNMRKVWFHHKLYRVYTTLLLLDVSVSRQIPHKNKQNHPHLPNAYYREINTMRINNKQIYY